MEIYTDKDIGFLQEVEVASYPRVDLPDYFTFLLSTTIHNTPAGQNFVTNHINQTADFLAITRKYFRDIDSQGRIATIIKAQGWEMFRNRLASIFVYKALHNRFPAVIDLSLIDDILEFEKKFISYKTEDNDRAFLLGLYLRFARIFIEREDAEDDYPFIDISDEVILLLKYSRVNIVNIDWVVLIMDLLHGSLGMADLHRKLEEGVSYVNIYECLSEEERIDFVENLLNYGYSIHEPDFFVHAKV